VIRLATHLGGARCTLLTGLALLAVGGDAQRTGAAALLGNVLSHVLVQILKRTVARPRPCDANGAPLALVELPDPFSFPSGHSAAAFAVAVPIALTWAWLAPLALATACYVGWTRVALRVHYASDVLAGALLGIGGAVAARQLLG
jgi:undecaprenyl-diphosphatase